MKYLKTFISFVIRTMGNEEPIIFGRQNLPTKLKFLSGICTLIALIYFFTASRHGCCGVLYFRNLLNVGFVHWELKDCFTRFQVLYF